MRACRDAVTVVSDDAAWTESVYAALGERGVEAMPISSLLLVETLSGVGVLLLDESLAPHSGSELGAELHALLADTCPPLLLAHPDPARMRDPGVFAAVLDRSSDPSVMASDVTRALARMPAASGFVLRSTLARDRSAG